ncbi:MAG: SDR family NAD(P)-dependent oxidoreductase [Mycobacteriaceae bacterium]
MSLVTAALDVALDKLVVPGYSALGPALRRRWWPADPEPFTGHPDVLVTGASSGLGRATAAGLARLGARVHLVGRSTQRLRDSAAVIRAEVPGADLVLRECDVSDLDAVAGLVATLSEELVALHALVHCAGLVPKQRSTSAQGHELALATHVLGPFALTVGLRELLHADGDGRVVFVSSGGMYPVPTVSRDLEYLDGEYKGLTAYARTKRMQVALVERMATALNRSGDPVVHSMHPGWADTPGVTGSIPGFARLTSTVLRTPEQGADTIVWLAAAAEPGRRTGVFWHDRRPRSPQFLPFTHDDPTARARLWEACQQATGLTL